MAGNSFLMQRFINLNYTFFFQTGNLAMESLLSLTSLRAGEWFKEENLIKFAAKPQQGYTLHMLR
jgi:hypothetical protein